MNPYTFPHLEVCCSVRPRAPGAKTYKSFETGKQFEAFDKDLQWKHTHTHTQSVNNDS